MRVISGLVPPGSWHFLQDLDSGQHQRIEGRTYNELLERVFLFRIQHIELVPSGTATRERVEEDVTSWICIQFPHNCTGPRNEFPFRASPPARQDYVRPINRVETWFKTIATRDLEWLDQSTATKRTRVCMGCALNQRWETNCGPCTTNIRTRSLLIRGSHKTGFESQLRSCLAYGWLLEVAVWLKDGHAGEPRRKPPPECWQRAADEASKGVLTNG